MGPFDCFGAEALGYPLKILTVDRSCHVPWKSMSLRTLVGRQARRNAKEGARSKDFRASSSSELSSVLLLSKRVGRALFFGLCEYIRG